MQATQAVVSSTGPASTDGRTSVFEELLATHVTTGEAGARKKVYLESTGTDSITWLTTDGNAAGRLKLGLVEAAV